MTRSLTSRASQLSWAADAARHAPSIFNTQPWRWRVSDNTLELWADDTRALAEVDPTRRLLTLSCGAALHHARVALIAGGDEVRVERLPNPAQPDLLARLRLPVSGSRPGDDGAQARYAAITLRRSDRRPFAERPVDPAVLEQLRDAAEREGAHLHLLDGDDIVVLAAAAARATEFQSADPAYRALLHRWTNGPRWTGDGVPAGSVPPAGPRRVPLRPFQLEVAESSRVRVADDVDGPARGTDRQASYAILWGDADEPICWLEAGEALSAVLLASTVAGLATSTISDVVEVDATREVLRGLIAGLGQPYLVLRIGYPQEPPPRPSPRRPASDVIEESD